MERWLHEVMDRVCLGETDWRIHQFKDSPSQIPSLGRKHRAVRHHEWREWAQQWHLDAKGPLDVLNGGTERLLGRYALVPAQNVPKGLERAWLQWAVSVGHEAYDEIWSSFDAETRHAMTLGWALILLDDSKWDADNLCDPAFWRLRKDVASHVLPRYRADLEGRQEQ